MDPIKDSPGFCWIRYDAEDADLLEQKEQQKQREQDLSGVFTWAVPPSLARSIRELALVNVEYGLSAVFSPDAVPGTKERMGQRPGFLWSDPHDAHGEPATVPEGLEVVSQEDGSSHTVLLCRSIPWPDGLEQETQMIDLRTETGAVVPGMLTHLVSSNPVSRNQTVVAVRHEGVVVGDRYRGALPVTLRAQLVWPYLLTFQEREPLG